MQLKKPPLSFHFLLSRSIDLSLPLFFLIDHPFRTSPFRKGVFGIDESERVLMPFGLCFGCGGD